MNKIKHTDEYFEKCIDLDKVMKFVNKASFKPVLKKMITHIVSTHIDDLYDVCTEYANKYNCDVVHTFGIYASILDYDSSACNTIFNIVSSTPRDQDAYENMEGYDCEYKTVYNVINDRFYTRPLPFISKCESDKSYSGRHPQVNLNDYGYELIDVDNGWRLVKKWVKKDSK